MGVVSTMGLMVYNGGDCPSRPGGNGVNARGFHVLQPVRDTQCTYCPSFMYCFKHILCLA